ncbi:MAG TPA: NUDIX hydrolase [Aggregatilineales bacterium]|nr:NUDIX hydrolase [Anaerolineales bacterium]HRE49308.1 NUDIX hydrolase [Aggregatilineales bacterium]
MPIKFQPQAGRWETVASRLVLDRSPFARLYDEDVALPDGTVIEGFARCVITPFVITFALLEDGRVPFVRQYRRALNDFPLELPAGFIEFGAGENSDPLHTAQRELLEETGAEAAEWFPLGQYMMDSTKDCGTAHCFAARGARLITAPNPGDLGELSLHLLTLEEVRQRWLAGGFPSAPTALTVGLALARLGV